MKWMQPRANALPRRARRAALPACGADMRRQTLACRFAQISHDPAGAFGLPMGESDRL